MKLFVSARSPFARRIRLALQRVGLPYEEVILNVFEEQPELTVANPLGLVPVLKISESETVSDSALILEWIHHKTSAIWVDRHPLGFQHRQLSEWCAGVMQLTVNRFIELSAHEDPAKDWVADYESSIALTIDRLAKYDPKVWFSESEIFQAGWDLAVMIQYLQLRMPEFASKMGMPSSWIELMDRCSKNETFVSTVPKL